ncbi:MAG: SigB/SigF/SigG family RNA polymerase sigma factor [Baekduiaceae bacterium]
MPATRINDDDATLLRRFHDTRDPALRATLAERLMPLAQSIARRYAHRGEPLDDLVQVGAIGLLKALDRFDPDRGVPFSGYAAPTIDGEIRRHFRDTGWMVRPPRNLQELVLRVNATIERLTVDLGREPTTEELAEATNASVEEIAEALHAGTGYRATSLDEPSGDNDFPRVEAIGDIDAEFARADARHDARLGLAALRPRERQIIALRFWGGLSQREIATELGISQMHVSRLVRASLDLMRAGVGGDTPQPLELAPH